MDGQAQRGNERLARRVIALLAAFAVLAERAAARSLAVRWLVLLILRRAETAAAAFVLEETGMPPTALEGLAALGNGPEDALRLAARFHALAAALCALLPLGHGTLCGPSRCGLAYGHLAQGSGHGRGGFIQEPYDTS